MKSLSAFAVAAAAAAAVIATPGAAMPRTIAAPKAHVAFKDRGDGQTFKGRFTLESNYTPGADSGTSQVQPNELKWDGFISH